MKKEEQELNKNEIITLMDIYLEEWKHRDSILWAQAFRFFYATLIVMLLPNLTSYLHISLPSNIPVKAFPIIGIVMAIGFLYISLGYSMRLAASSKTYQNIINLLEKTYQRVSVGELKAGKLFKGRIGIQFPILMFVSLLLIGIILIVS